MGRKEDRRPQTVLWNDDSAFDPGTGIFVSFPDYGCCLATNIQSTLCVFHDVPSLELVSRKPVCATGNSSIGVLVILLSIRCTGTPMLILQRNGDSSPRSTMTPAYVRSETAASSSRL